MDRILSQQAQHEQPAACSRLSWRSRTASRATPSAPPLDPDSFHRCAVLGQRAPAPHTARLAHCGRLHPHVVPASRRFGHGASYLASRMGPGPVWRTRCQSLPSGPVRRSALQVEHSEESMAHHRNLGRCDSYVVVFLSPVGPPPSSRSALPLILTTRGAFTWRGSEKEVKVEVRA